MRSSRQPNAAAVSGSAVASAALAPASSSSEPVVVGVGLRTARPFNKGQDAVTRQPPAQMPEKLESPKNIRKQLPEKKKITVFGLREPTGVFKANQDEMRRRPVKPLVAREWERTYVMEQTTEPAKGKGFSTAPKEPFVFL